MEFIEFIHLLKSVIGEGISTSDFTKNIFDNLVSDDASYLLDDVSVNTYKAYYNGNTAITKFVQKISCHIERMSFEEYLDSFDDSTCDMLVQTFKPHIDNLSTYDVSIKITDFFINILLVEAKKERKSKKDNNDTNKKFLGSEKAMDTLSNNINSKKGIKTKVLSEIPSDKLHTTIIQNQTNITQNGDKNINLTNNGTINIKL